MLTIKEAKIKDYIKLKKLNRNITSPNFFTQYSGNILSFIIKKRCFIFESDKNIKGYILIRDDIREIYFIPGFDKSISFFNLIYILKIKLRLRGYKLCVRYCNLNIHVYRKYFSIKIIKNVEFMHKPLNEIVQLIPFNKDSIKVRSMKIGQEEFKRVYLQNKIFSDNKNRKELTIDEVIYEENCSKFLRNLCFFIEKDNTPFGYGQVIYSENKFVLVNFGITEEYRGKGYGRFFINEIMNICIRHNIQDLYLSVDRNNDRAVNLYSSVGFKEVYNEMELMF